MESFYKRTFNNENTRIVVFKLPSNNIILFLNPDIGYVSMILNQKVETRFKGFCFRLLKRKNKKLNFPSMVKNTNIKETKNLFFSYLKQLSSCSLSQSEMERIFEECVLPEISICDNFMFVAYFNPINGGETYFSTYLFTL